MAVNEDQNTHHWPLPSQELIETSAEETSRTLKFGELGNAGQRRAAAEVEADTASLADCSD